VIGVSSFFPLTVRPESSAIHSWVLSVWMGTGFSILSSQALDSREGTSSSRGVRDEGGTGRGRPSANAADRQNRGPPPSAQTMLACGRSPAPTSTDTRGRASYCPVITKSRVVTELQTCRAGEWRATFTASKHTLHYQGSRPVDSSLQDADVLIVEVDSVAVLAGFGKARFLSEGS
jgi:hypothetical protein